MPIVAATIAAKEAAKKTIKEKAKQIAKGMKNEALKGKLKQAVKAEIKEEVKDKVVEEIDDKVMDVGAVKKALEIAKGGGLIGKLSQAVKGEARERVMDYINENIINVGVIQKGKTALDAAKTSDGASEKVNASDSLDGKNTESMAENSDVNDKTSGSTDMPEKSLKDKLSEAVKDDVDHGAENTTEMEADEQKSDISTDDKKGDQAEADDVTSDSDEKKADKPDDPVQKTEKYEANSYVTIDGERYRTDDNGNIYQKRNPETGTYEGIPNTTYELNGYHYETDGKGRIKKAGGTLQERNHEGRPTINDNVDGKKENDEKCHLIGDQFNGSNLNGNLVAMDFDVNRSDYKILEEKLSKYVNEEHKKVEYSIEPKYEGDSSRPSKFVVKYTIDGETFKETFKN